ncbi:Protein transport protein S9 plasma membrane t-SNARE [Malassezia caprae]|uniref:Protein transport protein S9 plasma membrane t-SNARE n=1 Tax=Malassezia caprae TaxID=1381934 RepID=A0AAF0E6J6_9BASI|nr:Protein transport protein S9 plasma membrane t-SNARE [Malassezia caprae]
MKPLFQRGGVPSSSQDLKAYVASRAARDPYGDDASAAYGRRDPYDAGPTTQNGMNRMPPPPPPSWGGAKPSDAELLAEYGSGSTQPSGSGMSAGYSAQPSYGSSTTASYRDPYSDSQMAQAYDPEEEEIQAIKFQIRNTKQESLSSTRNALRLARETEETATNTMVKLGDQSDKIGDTERSLDIAKAHTSRVEDNARTIAQLNQSIFRPKWKRNQKAKRDAEEARALQRHIDERTERELTRAEMLSSQKRVEESVSNMGMFAKIRNKAGVFGTNESFDPKEQRARYQFEATESDDELEDELDGNLDEISALSARMNLLSRAMGQEVDEQNKRLGRVSDKTSALDSRIYAGTKRLENLK